MIEVDQKEERPEYYAIAVTLLHCTAANYEHAKGERACIVTIGRKAVIEPLVFSMDDSRKLVTRLLVALATNKDEFARKLLDDNFPTDEEHDFRWPGPHGG